MHSEQGSRKEQPWRSELEIEMARQEELARHLAITPDIKQGVYPFRGIKLSRADVEWLVATHENAQSSQASSDEQQQHPQGLDLRGADLRYADLHALPLARLRGSLTREEWEDATEEQRAAAAVLLTGANLSEAHLEEADLIEAHLEKAALHEAHLEKADLARAHMDRAFLARAHLKEADLSEAHLEKADLSEVHMQGATLKLAHLERAYLNGAHLEKANLSEVRLEKVYLSEAHLEQALLSEAHLEEGYLSGAYLKAADLSLAHLEGAYLNEAHLEDTSLYKAHLERTFLYRAHLEGVRLSRTHIKEARLKKAVESGEQYLFSLLLDLLAGYGYRPGRSVEAYLVVIFGFMGLYLLNAHSAAVHLTWDEALVLSVISFHGRGFFLQNIALGDTFVRLAAAEAVLGLVIEISFIATFTQRFLGR